MTFFAKCGILDFEGIPETVGGLNFLLLPLPLLELRFNRRELVAGAVISFSCRGDSDYYFYDYSKCIRSR